MNIAKNRNDYKYVEVPLTASIAEELILELFSGKTASRKNITDAIIRGHVERGGTEPNVEDVARHVTGKALRRLKTVGIAKNPSAGYWSVRVNPNITYKYTEVALIPSIAEELILELFSGKTASRQEIVDLVVSTHSDRGGTPAEVGDVRTTIKSALRKLKQKELAEDISYRYWKIAYDPNAPVKAENGPSETHRMPVSKEYSEYPVSNGYSENPVEKTITIGRGTGAVYLYYLPEYQHSAKRSGKSVWQCKIGMTENDVDTRVKSQATTALPEEPEIALIMRTNNPRALEKSIHAILDLQGKRTKTSGGSEWFMTSPMEVEQIYKRIMNL